MFKIRELATGKVILREALDAKESVATGRYEYVGDHVPVGKTVVPEGQDEDNKDNKKTEDFNPNDIKRMNTEELSNLVTERELTIENFGELNLKEKRAAVFEAVTGTKED